MPHLTVGIQKGNNSIIFANSIAVPLIATKKAAIDIRIRQKSADREMLPGLLKRETILLS